jgi:hypothetical protein
LESMPLLSLVADFFRYHQVGTHHLHWITAKLWSCLFVQVSRKRVKEERSGRNILTPL